MVPSERNANVNPPDPDPDPPVLLLLVSLLLSRIIQSASVCLSVCVCVCVCVVCIYSVPSGGSFRGMGYPKVVIFSALPRINKREKEEEDEKKRAAKWTPMVFLFVTIQTTENHSLSLRIRARFSVPSVER